MSTPLSSSTPYATVADLLARYDARTVGDLAGDAGSRVSAADLADANTAGGANVAAALADASGQIEAACLRGGRYLPADLAALTGMSAKRLVRLTCRVTMLLLMERRPDSKWPEWAKDVEAELDRVAKGERVFGLREVVDASVMGEVVPPDAQPGPRPALSEVARRVFGRRARTEPGE